MSISSRLILLLLLVGTHVAIMPTVLTGQSLPEAPSNTEVFILGENALDVTWTDNSENETAFDIYRTDGNNPEVRIGATDRNLTLFQDRASGIVPEVRYCYTVRARNSLGSSAPSEEACVTIPPRPAAPTGLLSSRADNNSAVILTWIPNSTNQDGFLVYRDAVGASALVLIDTVAASSNRYEDKVIRANGLYRYFVSAFNVTGESEGSNVSEIDVTVNEPALPISFGIETLSGTQIALEWSFDLITFASLGVERSEGSSGPWDQVFETTAIATAYTDSELSPDTEYCYRLRLASASNVEALSEVVCSQTEFTVPPVPEGVDATGLESRSIRVEWGLQPSPRVLFRVERQDGLSEYRLIADSLDALTFTDVGLSDDETYCYRIQSFNPQFASTFSTPGCAIVAPAPVSDLRVSAGPDAPSHEITASWSQGAGTPATSFEVSFRPAGEGEFSTPTITNSLSLLIQGLSDFTEYEVEVVAFRARDTLSSKSAPILATGSTFLSVWPGDMDDDGTVSENDVVVLTSDACFGATTDFATDGLDVSWREIAVDPGGSNPTVLRCDADRDGEVDIFDFLAIAANIGRLTGGTQQSGTAVTRLPVTSAIHRERIKRIYEGFVPEPGNQAQERLKTGLAEILQKAGSEVVPDEFRLGGPYPNPIRSTATIPVDVADEGPLNLSLFSVTGQRIRQIERSSFSPGRYQIRFDTDGLPAGVYFLVLEAGGESLTRSLTIVR